MLVGAVGIELKTTLKTRKLLIPLNAKNAKNSEFAQVRYTAGTRRRIGIDQASVRLLGGTGLISMRRVLIVPDALLSILGTGRLAFGLRASKKTSQPSRRRLWFM
jgi:hypothetical protein